MILLIWKYDFAQKEILFCLYGNMILLKWKYDLQETFRQLISHSCLILVFGLIVKYLYFAFWPISMGWLGLMVTQFGLKLAEVARVPLPL